MNKTFHFFILVSIVIAVSIIAGIFWYTDNALYIWAVGGPPAHSHEGYELLTGGECNSTATHFQDEMNWLHDNLPGFTDTGTYGSWYPLDPDNCYSGSVEEDNAAREFQNWANITVDGDTGNETWTYMEFWVLQSPGLAVDASEHPAGAKVRYPIWSECRAITNNNTSGIAAPVKTSAEWDAYKLNAPNITNAAGDCSTTGSIIVDPPICSDYCKDSVCGFDSCPDSCGTTCSTSNCIC